MEVSRENNKEMAAIPLPYYPNEISDESPPIQSRNKCISCLKSNTLTLATVTGVILGAVLGIVLKQSRDWSEREIMYISFPGDLFLRMLKSLILPLIVSSLISAIASLDLSLSKRVAARAIAYYLTTTFAAVVLGMVLVVSIKPGANHSGETSQDAGDVVKRNVTTVDTLLDLIRNMFPPNIVQACIEQQRTLLVNPGNETDVYKFLIKSEIVSGMNILGLVVFSAVLGVALAQLGDEAKTLANFFNSLTASMMRMTTWVIYLSPVGILFLVAAQIMEMEDFAKTMEQLGLYFTTVIVGLLIQALVVLPLLYFFLTRKNPVHFVSNIAQALATAFGTASSSATLPITIRCLEDNLGIDPRIARFALPIGATINMDGTALYEAVAAIFIAQIHNIELSVGTLISISITATAASIGAAGIPQAGLVTMVMVLDTVGLPAESVAYILAVDWLLDRFRTTINVMGDAFGAAIVHHRSKKELENMKV